MAKCLLLALLPLLAEGGGHANATTTAAPDGVTCVGGSFSLDVSPDFEASKDDYLDVMKATVSTLSGGVPVEQIHVEITVGGEAVQDNCAAAYEALAAVDIATAAPAPASEGRDPEAPAPAPEAPASATPAPARATPAPAPPTTPAGTTTAAPAPAATTTAAPAPATTPAGISSGPSSGPSEGPSGGPSSRLLGAHATEQAHVGYAVVARESEIAAIQTSLAAVTENSLAEAIEAAVEADDTIEAADFADLIGGVSEGGWATPLDPISAPTPAPQTENQQDNFASRTSLSLVGLAVVTNFVIA